MDLNAARRLLIAQRSPIQRRIDPRPRCEGCARVLTMLDFESYWDGCPTMKRRHEVPCLCEPCCEKEERASRRGKQEECA